MKVLLPDGWAPPIGYANGIAVSARRELGAIWRKHMGNHRPAMSMIFVADLLDSPGKIELEATAVPP